MKKRSLDEITARVYNALLERFGEPIGDNKRKGAGVSDERHLTCQCGGENIVPIDADGNVKCKDCKRVWMPIDEVAPPGRERQVKALKKEKGVDNPFAVAWASYDKAHGKKPKKEGDEADAKIGLKKGEKKEPVVNENELVTCNKCGASEKQPGEFNLEDGKYVCPHCSGKLGESKKRIREAYGSAKPVVHIMKDYIRSRDPDARSEVASYCGEFEECSGSGKHGMAHSDDDATCPRCKALYANRPSYNDDVDY